MEQVVLCVFIIAGSAVVIGLLILAVMTCKMLLEIAEMLDKLRGKE